jgi:hypothetical protein
MVVAATLVIAGCGGGSSATGTGGHAAGQGGSGGSGGAGATGSAGSPGVGGSHAAGGSVATGGASGALPTCAIVAQPPDPDAGYGISATADTCNSLTVPATSISATGLAPIDGGVVLDGGVIESPAGGTILDGDYQMVRWMNNPDDGETITQRAIRVFEGGAYIEWAFKQPDQVTVGSTDNVRYDTRATVSGHTMTFSVTCGGGVLMPNYDYTASGDLLAFFVYAEDYTTGEYGYLSLDTYQRTCTRP